MLNILFLGLATLFIFRKGGISYLSTKIFQVLNAKRKGLPVADETYYLHQKSQFEILPKSNLEIIFLGDSITDECEWSELLRNFNVKNRGISGDTTNGILNRLSDLLKSNPKKIFLMVGINDFLHTSKSVEQIFVDYEKIVTTVRDDSQNTELFIQSVLPVNNSKYKIKVNNENVVKLNERLQELATDTSCQYIDLFPHLSDSQNQLDSRYTWDGIHLNGQAYLVWKQVIEKYIVD
ncbi:MAG TPA: G-D-S-L family lipolytic protein [Cyanobacteria bacterium UBA11049]|nr:G-D-S-L family lipolytic protein [Cyanobacteria bacterium UBA11049]